MRAGHPPEPPEQLVGRVLLELLRVRRTASSVAGLDASSRSTSRFTVCRELVAWRDVQNFADVPPRRAVAAIVWTTILYFISAVCHSFARIVGHISHSRCFGSTNIVAFVSG